MFILVNRRSVYTIGGRLGSPWLTFKFWRRLTKSLLYNVHCVCLKKIQKTKRSKTCGPTFFYKEYQHVRQFGNEWSSVVKQDVQSWLTGVILCLVHAFTVNYCAFLKIFGSFSMGSGRTRVA